MNTMSNRFLRLGAVSGLAFMVPGLALRACGHPAGEAGAVAGIGMRATHAGPEAG